MAFRVERHQQAIRDLDEQAAYMARDNPDAARRFLGAAEAEFTKIAENPRIGRRREFRSPQLSGLRSWRITGFDNHLVFYRIHQDHIEVLRVVHGARDLPTVLGDDPP